MLKSTIWASGLILPYQSKIIIAGSRSIIDPNLIYPILDDHFSYIGEVVCGTALGVDTIGAHWAIDRQVRISCFKPDWHPNGHYDKSAGYKRNIEMGEYAHGLLAFWDGQSRGTNHMINIMDRLGKPYVVYKLAA